MPGITFVWCHSLTNYLLKREIFFGKPLEYTIESPKQRSNAICNTCKPCQLNQKCSGHDDLPEDQRMSRGIELVSDETKSTDQHRSFGMEMQRDYEGAAT